MAQPHVSGCEEYLKQRFIGKSLQDIEGPAVVLDLAVLKRNCRLMLDAADTLGLDFRAHLKTHKTSQLTRLQVGDDRSSEARVIVSTIPEAEQQVELLSEYQKKGRSVNLLYGIPPSRRAYERLRNVRQKLGAGSVSFLIDQAAQIASLVDPDQAREQVPVFVNVDVGYHREGLEPASNSLEALLKAIHAADNVKLLGFYSHNSLSYASGSATECMDYLMGELQGVFDAAKRASALGLVPASGMLTLSVGASPQVLSIQSLATDETSTKVKTLLDEMKATYNVELHAGVYPVLDCQQLAARSRPTASSATPSMTERDIAIRVLAEVLSVYTERGRPEALVAAGTLALGREPCKSYPGWGVVGPWPGRPQRFWTEESPIGWTVGRISQEHGILVWQGPEDQVQRLTVGDKLLVWPNHACIASASYEYYYVVDSGSGEDSATRITDIWMRARGW